MIEIDLSSALETNVLKLGTMTMEAHADRLLIVQDPFVSGYECTRCGGKMIQNEVSYVVCDECSGQRFNVRQRDEEIVQIKCSACEGQGKTPCPDCGGKGGLIVVPDASERRPTTGTIASVGWMVDESNWFVRIKHWLVGQKSFKRGESVIYPSFAGHAYDLTAEDAQGNPIAITIVILRESEVLAKISGHLELRRVKRSTAFNTAA